ncbi:hypothetical protein VTI28DRAFT_1075 [Corynascus sepedonium]
MPAASPTLNPVEVDAVDNEERFTTPLARLQYLYDDVTRLREIASPAIILHPADRDLRSPLSPRPPLVGIAAAQRYEEALVVAAAGAETAGKGAARFAMEVESMTVDSQNVFGCVMGVLRVGRGFGNDISTKYEQEEGKKTSNHQGGHKASIEMPFCGVWRFDETGRAVEHWYVNGDISSICDLFRLCQPCSHRTVLRCFRIKTTQLTLKSRENVADPVALAKWLRGE